MKKLIMIILLGFIVGCSPKPYVINTYTPDMSGYVELQDATPFVGISAENFVDALRNKQSMIVYIGYDLCPNCQEMIDTLSKVALDLNAKVYYIDGNNEKYPLGKGEQELLKKELSGILLTDERHEKVIYAPHVFSVVKGKLVSSLVGLPDDHNSTYNEYYKIFKDIY